MTLPPSFGHLVSSALQANGGIYHQYETVTRLGHVGVFDFDGNDWGLGAFLDQPVVTLHQCTGADPSLISRLITVYSTSPKIIP